MNRDDLLNTAIRAKTDPIHMSTKAQIWEYYLDQNEGNKTKAASAAAQALSGQTSGKEYRNQRRNFEGNRINQLGDKPKWKAFGTQLPEIGRKLKGDSLTLTVKGKQGIYKKGKRTGTRERTIEVTFKGANAQGFIEDPSYYSIWDEYGVDADLFDEGDYEIEVYAVG